MAGNILIVDAIATNRIVLKVKLASAFFQVVQAASLAEALETAAEDTPDLIICALDLPDGGAAALCAALARNPTLRHVPVMAIGCRADNAARMAALEAGAQDVMMKPLDDTLLLGRVRSLIRAHNASAEWRMREGTCEALGLAEAGTSFAHAGHCVLVSDDSARAQTWMQQLRGKLRSRLTWVRPADVLRDIEKGAPPDVYVLVPSDDSAEAAVTARLISILRANGSTRHAGVLVLQTRADPALAAHALDLGADDLMTDGFDLPELVLRLKALMRRKQTDAQLRATYRTGVKAAIHDPLTGLYNRRYAMPHLNRIASHARQTGKPFAVLVADLDHFKLINDQYGHAAGDAVLVEVAERLRGALRGADMVARIGGEEFLIVMPGTTPEDARGIAVRICNDISGAPFTVPGLARPIPVTISIGMAIGDASSNSLLPADETAGETLLAQADKALYSAKMRGRNCVRLGRPAA